MAVLLQILPFVLGELGKFIVAFILNLTKGESFNQAVADAALVIVQGVEQSTLSRSSMEKRDLAVDALNNWHLDNSLPPPPVHVANALVELAVNHLKATQGGVV